MLTPAPVVEELMLGPLHQVRCQSLEVLDVQVPIQRAHRGEGPALNRQLDDGVGTRLVAHGLGDGDRCMESHGGTDRIDQLGHAARRDPAVRRVGRPVVDRVDRDLAPRAHGDASYRPVRAGP